MMISRIIIYLIFSSALLFLACATAEQTNIEDADNKVIFLKEKCPSHLRYNWLENSACIEDAALVNQIKLPVNYKREFVEKGSFEEWLRFLPLLPENQKVMYYDGRVKPYQDGAYRVLNIDIGNSDLQQCADAIMRLKAEYHFSRGEFAKIHFNYTSGHKVSFDDWRKGKKPLLSGSKMSFSTKSIKEDNSYSNFKKYLRNIFIYAGTASLEKELNPKDIKDVKAGDIFIKGGFPGHAVLVLDVAVHTESGKKIFLLGQSYMPAQSFHVLQNFRHDQKLSPWYPEDFGEILHTPEWEFKRTSIKEF